MTTKVVEDRKEAVVLSGLGFRVWGFVLFLANWRLSEQSLLLQLSYDALGFSRCVEVMLWGYESAARRGRV